MAVQPFASLVSGPSKCCDLSLGDYQRNEEEDQSSTSGEDQARVALDTGSLSGRFRVKWGCMLNAAGGLVSARLYNVTDATELDSYTPDPTVFGVETERLVERKVFVDLSGVPKTLELRYGNVSGKSDDVNVERAYIEIWRVE